jgi:hypothetical protein
MTAPKIAKDFEEFKAIVRNDCANHYLTRIPKEKLDAYLLSENKWLKEMYDIKLGNSSGVAFGLGMMYEPSED